MTQWIDDMFSKKSWAVVGVTTNPSKFGYKIYRRLLAAGYTVYPVNPNYDQIEGETCYPSLEAIPAKIDNISVVVSPDRAMQVVAAAAQLSVTNIWFQPGTYDEGVLEAAKEKKLNAVYGHCVLVELNTRGK